MNINILKTSKVFYDYVTNTWRNDDALVDSVLWNYYDFKSLKTNNHIEGWLDQLIKVVHPHLSMQIQNDYAYNSVMSSCHLATGL